MSSCTPCVNDQKVEDLGTILEIKTFAWGFKLVLIDHVYRSNKQKVSICLNMKWGGHQCH